MSDRKKFSSGGHWGVFDVTQNNDGILVAEPHARDPNPTPLIDSAVAASQNTASRVLAPMVRKTWLESGPTGNGAGRGAEPFVKVSWDQATELVANELSRIYENFGPEAIYAGSYGWASAGKLHQAQGVLKRFLGLAGGFTNSVGNYSNGAASVLMPHILGSGQSINGPLTSWQSIAENSDLLLSFGGVPLKNTQINYGGLPEHDDVDWQKKLSAAKLKIVCVSPVREDSAGLSGSEWIGIRPNTDTALMLGLAFEIYQSGSHDSDFLNRYCTGFEKFCCYLTGELDGQPKDCDWASEICEIPAERIKALAEKMSVGRTMITACWSLQRSDHGEQPYWMAVTLAAMLGQIGLPGGGMGFGYGCLGGIGTPRTRAAGPAFSVGQNPSESYIPVARITDMLLNPGADYAYNGENLAYPDIHAIYWCGGNPFHHHQNINRLLEGWRRIDTVIVHEPFWTSAARHADIVLPTTTTLERNDIGVASVPAMWFAIQKAMEPLGEARNDYDIFSEIAGHLGFREEYTENRNEMDWLRHMYDVARQKNAETGIEMPDFDKFWEIGAFEFERPERPVVLMESFRNDPDAKPLKTPSGKIEIFSETIDGFGYDDCPGHPVWLEPTEWLGSEKAAQYPLHLISNQPSTRLHSQLDTGPLSVQSKIAGREPIFMNEADAADRNLIAGDIVRVFNDRGACLAGLVISDGLRPGVVQLATGAWYDPLEPGVADTLDRHGNPNMLTTDKGTSQLAQAPASQTALVEIERYDSELPEITVHSPPPTV
ncbi:MAG: Asp-tRNA(Asn)/Glu-tRNA(Gln) amidotransferase GatCAB subunit C [Rhodospirillaceae bacterium]|mgnify:CR=1 FL=1|nr:Asp-tRNA(Asn)/Glu-tRNA(Gln) amidotransferase GatCAB subunit C [Rhodospirillaceae bacterium]